MQADLHSAFLLHRRSYRESSLLLELFSSQQGRVGAVARGATRRGTASGMLLQPFRPLLVAWSSRRGDLATLTHCEAAGPQLLASGREALCGFYLNELVLRALPRNDPHPGTFEHYERALRMLGESMPEMERTLRIFEKHLLDAVGYGLMLDHDADTQAPIEAHREYLYVPGHGPTLAGQGANVPGSIPVHGATLRALQCERFGSDTELSEAKRLMRALLGTHLGDRPLTSRAWFEDY